MNLDRKADNNLELYPKCEAISMMKQNTLKAKKIDSILISHKGLKYKLFFLLICMFLIVLESKSQTFNTNCLHYPYNTQVGINLNINLMSKMRIQQNYYGKPLPSNYIRSYPSFGADLGVYLYQRVYKWFGIQIGAEYSASTFSYGTTAKFSDEKSKHMDFYGFGAFTFPILFNASYYFNQKHGLDISLGGAPLVLFLGDAGTGIGFGGDKEGENHCRIRLENDTRFNFSLYGKIGYNLLLKNKNTFGIAIVGSYAAEPYSKGYYLVRKEGQEEGGYTSLRNTFIGLQFSYGFTMKKLLCTEKITTVE